MNAIDALDAILSSALFQGTLALIVVAGCGHVVVQAVRSQERLVAFMKANRFYWTETGSTMWLARLIERWEMCDIWGQIDGRRVDVRSLGRRGRLIMVTAKRGLVSGSETGTVSIGTWTRPKPPALLEGVRMEASGRELRVHLGGGDFVPYIFAAVAYAGTLEEQPATSEVLSP